MLAIVATTMTFAQSKHKTENVVVILIDGYRWQELFKGADYNLLNIKKYNAGDSLQRMKKFWAEDLNERRKKLMPFTWNYIATHGQLYGNRELGNNVNVLNPYWFSYPGRAEILSGFVDTSINSNSYPSNPNTNVLEYINNQKAFAGKVVTFACWGATGRCLHKDKSNMLINVPWEDIQGNHLTETEILANEMQHYIPQIFGDDERLDANVYALAKSYILASHPKVTYIDFGDTDEYAHAGQYENYLDDIFNLDAMIGNLWRMMQNDLFYKNNKIIRAEKYFMGKISGADLKESKPHPEIFQLAAQIAGEPKENCMVIEDSTNGIHAAHAAQIFCTAYKSKHSTDQNYDKANLLVSDFADIHFHKIAAHF